ncbi:hypothetical protein [Bacillus sp. Bva_UNVM-123]|uniref:hypothetical protein n=1 Tax=Bacillus sp. Bva_UNVM-123 TaxID=2829798 RepID=UPI00391EF38F
MVLQFILIAGENVGFNEIISISLLLMMYFSAITWGTKESKDGIMQEEELGRRINEKSSLISYYVLPVLILLAMVVDQWMNGTVNIFLTAILGIGVITQPFVAYLIARKYQ